MPLSGARSADAAERCVDGVTEREQQDALDLLKRTLTFLPDTSAVDFSVRQFLRRHDPVWSEMVAEGERLIDADPGLSGLHRP